MESEIEGSIAGEVKGWSIKKLKRNGKDDDEIAKTICAEVLSLANALRKEQRKADHIVVLVCQHLLYSVLKS